MGESPPPSCGRPPTRAWTPGQAPPGPTPPPRVSGSPLPRLSATSPLPHPDVSTPRPGPPGSQPLASLLQTQGLRRPCGLCPCPPPTPPASPAGPHFTWDPPTRAGTTEQSPSGPHALWKGRALDTSAQGARAGRCGRSHHTAGPSRGGAGPPGSDVFPGPAVHPSSPGDQARGRGLTDDIPDLVGLLRVRGGAGGGCARPGGGLRPQRVCPDRGGGRQGQARGPQKRVPSGHRWSGRGRSRRGGRGGGRGLRGRGEARLPPGGGSLGRGRHRRGGRLSEDSGDCGVGGAGRPGGGAWRCGRRGCGGLGAHTGGCGRAPPGGRCPVGGAGQQVVVPQQLVLDQQVHAAVPAEELVLWGGNGRRGRPSASPGPRGASERSGPGADALARD